MSSLLVTLIQSDLHWEDKEHNLAMFEEKIMNMREKTEIIILPEMFSTGFSMKPEQFAETMDGSTVSWMKHIAKEKKIILTGSLMIEENGKYYNRLIWMMPNEDYGYYDKRHLFSYAGEDGHYKAGNKRLIASVKGWKINLLVCYDLRFPVWARQRSETEAEYDVLIYVANWPERRINAWKTLLQARAIENQCYVIGANRVGNDGNNIYYSGDSMVVNAVGDILYQKTGHEDICTIELKKDHLDEIRNRFPFLHDADNFIMLHD